MGEKILDKVLNGREVTIEMVNRAYDRLSHPPLWGELDAALSLHIKYLDQKKSRQLK